MKRSFLILAVIATFAGLQVQAIAQNLGTAENFAVLGGSTVTNTGSSVVKGDLGVWPGLAVTGFPPGIVVPPGIIHAGDAVAQQAQSDLTTAYVALAGMACPPGPPPGGNDLTGIDLGGLTLTPGVYCFSASAQLTGVLTLDALGSGNALFVFQIGSTLTTASNSSVQLINGAQACNVFWQVGSSATLGTDTAFVGNILALSSITLTTSASLTGKALARNGAVTMDTNDVIDGCVALNGPSLAALTVDSVISCPRTLGTYCAGGNGATGISPAPPASCGLSFAGTVETPAAALNTLNHHWLQSTTTPLVADMGVPVNTVFVFPAVDHLPVPEEGIESTVWGSDSCDISTFPVGWTLATLTTIYAKGWEDPVACQPGPNSDDFVGQYSFFGSGFQFIAVYANYSVSIFETPTTWSAISDDDLSTPGWQSHDNEIDAIGTPICQPGDVVADAGPDQLAPEGKQVCFDGSNSTGTGGIATYNWDFDGNGVIDATGPVACITCDSIFRSSVTLFVTDTCGCVDTDTVAYDCNDPTNRVTVSEKGSLLFYSKIELRWNATAPFALIQDTILTIVNDYPADVYVQWYFINGDAPTAPQFTGNPPVLVERSHPGWNWVDCNTFLTHDESNYWSAATGSPLGCQPFSVLDPGSPPGRPDPENPGQRVLRGYAIAIAVDSAGCEISWNHLSGHVDIVNYADRSAWEYNTYAFQCVATPTVGAVCDTVSPPATCGELHLDGSEYDWAFDKLLFDFYAVGSQAFNQGLNIVTLDTDLTLYPLDVDLRQDNDGPVTTKAKFDIWNQNEDGFSGTTRCITCWDQTLLSSYGALSNFMLGVLHTDKGKARIDGIPSDVCDPPGACCDLATDIDCFPAADHPFIDSDCSVKAALLGVSDKILVFSGAASGRTDAGMTLVGQGEQSAVIRRDLIQPPDPLTTAPEAPEAQSATGLDDASPIPVRPSDRGGRSLLPDKR